MTHEEADRRLLEGMAAGIESLAGNAKVSDEQRHQLQLSMVELKGQVLASEGNITRLLTTIYGSNGDGLRARMDKIMGRVDVLEKADTRRVTTTGDYIKVAVTAILSFLAALAVFKLTGK